MRRSSRAFERALASARATGKPLAELTARGLPADGAARRGRGALAQRAHHRPRLPAALGTAGGALGEEDASRFFWAFGVALGWPGAQNPQGDLLGHVVDTGEDRANPLVRLYRTRSDIAYHCDAADVVGLLCSRRRGAVACRGSRAP